MPCTLRLWTLHSCRFLFLYTYCQLVYIHPGMPDSQHLIVFCNLWLDCNIHKGFQHRKVCDMQARTHRSQVRFRNCLSRPPEWVRLLLPISYTHPCQPYLVLLFRLRQRLVLCMILLAHLRLRLPHTYSLYKSFHRNQILSHLLNIHRNRIRLSFLNVILKTF